MSPWLNPHLPRPVPILFEVPGHTNRRHASLSAVVAGMQKRQWTGLSGQAASPRLEKPHGLSGWSTRFVSAQFDTRMSIDSLLEQGEGGRKVGSGGYQAFCPFLHSDNPGNLLRIFEQSESFTSLSLVIRKGGAEFNIFARLVSA